MSTEFADRRGGVNGKARLICIEENMLACYAAGSFSKGIVKIPAKSHQILFCELLSAK